MNSKLFYIIIILIIVTITIYINKYYVNKEGMDIGQFFGFVIKIFQLIPKLVEGIITIFSLMDDVFEMISCPYKVWTNFFKCIGWFWLTDIIFFILWFLWWWLLFIFIFIPASIGWNTVCLLFGNMFNACKQLEIEDVCTSKEDFFKFFDYLIFLISDFHLLYRDKGDVKNCYCHPAIRYAFSPLENQFKMFDLEDSNKLYGTPVILAIFVLFILFIKQSAHSTYKVLKNISSPSGAPSALPIANPIANISDIPKVPSLKF